MAADSSVVDDLQGASPQFACTTCRKRKRRCDKNLPICSTCMWLGTECSYSYNPGNFAPTKNQNTASNQESFQLWARGPSPSSQLTNASVGNTIVDHAARLFGTDAVLQSVMEEYFNSVQNWLPFLSKKLLMERRATIWAEHNNHVLLLVCCMHLMIQVPLIENNDLRKCNTYTQMKKLLALAESQEVPSVRLVQCRLLMALYEIGHGATVDAYLSIGTCARMAIVLGMDQQGKSLQHQNMPWVQLEEERRTWWSIALVERFIRVENVHWALIVKDATPSDILPIKDGDWDEHEEEEEAYTTLSAPPQQHVGRFARNVQVAHLLGRTLSNKFDPTSDSEFNAAEAEQLRRALRAYSDLLPQEAARLRDTGYCFPIAMCFCSRLILEDPTPEDELSSGYMDSISPSTEAICAELMKVLGITAGIHDIVSTRNLTPFTTNCIYRAAIIQERLWRFRRNIYHKISFQRIMERLLFYDRRWKIAGLYVRRLQTIIATNESDILIGDALPLKGDDHRS